MVVIELDNAVDGEQRILGPFEFIWISDGCLNDEEEMPIATIGRRFRILADDSEWDHCTILSSV